MGHFNWLFEGLFYLIRHVPCFVYANSHTCGSLYMCACICTICMYMTICVCMFVCPCVCLRYVFMNVLDHSRSKQFIESAVLKLLIMHNTYVKRVLKQMLNGSFNGSFQHIYKVSATYRSVQFALYS